MLKKGLKLAILSLIRLYQKTLSPDEGWFKPFFPHGYCQFYPHCSEYGYQAIDRYGVLKGTLLAGKRVLRCHPWSSGGYDPLRSKEKEVGS